MERRAELSKKGCFLFFFAQSFWVWCGLPAGFQVFFFCFFFLFAWFDGGLVFVTFFGGVVLACCCCSIIVSCSCRDRYGMVDSFHT